MFLAYEVKPANGILSGMTQPLLLPDQLDSVYNLPSPSSVFGQQSPMSTKYDVLTVDNTVDQENTDNYVRGGLLGFVEITQRQYGLGAAGGWKGGKTNSDTPFRPVLTNLAVAPAARKFGIGSTLLEVCEFHVQNEWKLHDIVLEVEDYNEKALQFYTKRGFQVIFSDPASRRYDVNGLWIKKVRCRREILRKVLSGSDVAENTTNMMNFDIFRKIRDGLGMK
jgi:ribosomal protein S18 acetylase RimI-like enzyme